MQSQQGVYQATPIGQQGSPVIGQGYQQSFPYQRQQQFGGVQGGVQGGSYEGQGNVGGVLNSLQSGIRSWWGSSSQQQFIPFQSIALITGASSGIGFNFARVFAENKFNLVLVGDNREQLFTARDELTRLYPQIRILPIVKDLTTPTAARELWDEIRGQNLVVDILVNNAGYTCFGKFLDVDIERHLRMVQLNVLSLVVLTHYFAQDMIRRGKGKIINISDLIAVSPSPCQAVYAASKAFVKSFSEAIAYELCGSGVTVSCILPGPTTGTQFTQRGGLYEGQVPRARTLPFVPQLDPNDVARRAFYASMIGKCEYVPGWTNWLYSKAAQVLPSELLMWFNCYLNNWK